MSDVIVHVCKDCKHAKTMTFEEVKCTFDAFACTLYVNRITGFPLKCRLVRQSNTCEGYEPRE